MRARSFGSVVVVLFAMVVSVGCKEPPAPQIQEARVALDELAQVAVDQWAPEAAQTARQALAQVDAELKVQGDKLGFLRDYQKTLELVASTKEAAVAAKAAAVEAKEKARAEATEAVEALSKSLADAQAMLATAPTGKGAEADLEMMKADLEAVSQAIAEAKAALESEKFGEVGAKVQAGLTRVESVKTAIQQAIAAVAAAGGTVPAAQ